MSSEIPPPSRDTRDKKLLLKTYEKNSQEIILLLEMMGYTNFMTQHLFSEFLQEQKTLI